MSVVTLHNGIELAYSAHGHGDPKHPIIFLHGVMGNKKNLTGFVNGFLAEIPDRSALIFDLRNHGESSKHQAPYTVESCAHDIKDACYALAITPHVIVGHSFGGKVALLLSSLLADVQSVWLLDCAPGPIPANNRLDKDARFSALKTIDALLGISWPVSSRAELVGALLAKGISKPIATWMTTNVIAKEHGLMLVFDPREMKAMIEDFRHLDTWPSVRPLSMRATIHLVAAEFGDRLTQGDEDRLKKEAFENGFFHSLKGAGHFLHADNPRGLIELMRPYF